jgi:hypothetical protein
MTLSDTPRSFERSHIYLRTTVLRDEDRNLCPTKAIPWEGATIAAMVTAAGARVVSQLSIVKYMIVAF